MTSREAITKIQNVLCPTDLSPKSQKTVGFAARTAAVLGAQLTVCNCATETWIYHGNRIPKFRVAEIKDEINGQVKKCRNPDSELRWEIHVSEGVNDPAREILRLSQITDADLLVLKARPGVMSALHLGSIVERVVAGAACPILMMPSRFLEKRDPVTDKLSFHRILFDYDFSQATDDLFHIANALTDSFEADLHVLSVLEPPAFTPLSKSSVSESGVLLQTTVERKLNRAIRSIRGAPADVPTTISWGDHADTILRYAETHEIDLICTTLSRPARYFEKIYKFYFGRLLMRAKCPILVKQSI